MRKKRILKKASYNVEVDKFDFQLADSRFDPLHRHWTIHWLIDEIWESRARHVSQIVLDFAIAARGDLSVKRNNEWTENSSFISNLFSSYSANRSIPETRSHTWRGEDICTAKQNSVVWKIHRFSQPSSVKLTRSHIPTRLGLKLNSIKLNFTKS